MVDVKVPRAAVIATGVPAGDDVVAAQLYVADPLQAVATVSEFTIPVMAPVNAGLAAP